MARTAPFAFALALVLFVAVNSAVGEVFKTTHNFEAKPNGQDQTVSASLLVDRQGEITCTFTYACQGGTGEDWNMMIEVDTAGVAQCTVGRSGASYLYFSHFDVTVTPNVQVVHAEVESPAGPLKLEEYTISGGSVKSSDKFQNAVVMVTAGWMPGELHAEF